MADMSRIKKLLGSSTTMPLGTGTGGAPNSTLTNMHTDRGGHVHGHGCGCNHSHDDEDEE